MAQDKKSFVLYSDNYGLIKQLPDDVAGRLLKHIFAYVNDENPATEELLVNIAFEPIKMALKRDLKKYEQIKEKRSLAGKKSAELRQQNSTNSTHVDFVQQTSTNPTVSDSDSVSDSVSVSDSDSEILFGKEPKINEVVESQFVQSELITEENEPKKVAQKKGEKFDFKKALIDYGFNQKLVEEWLVVRKTKKAVNTETAFGNFIREIESRQCNINFVLETIVSRSWSGFKYQWLDNEKNNQNRNNGSEKSNAEIFDDAYNSEIAKGFRFGNGNS